MEYAAISEKPIEIVDYSLTHRKGGLGNISCSNPKILIENKYPETLCLTCLTYRTRAIGFSYSSRMTHMSLNLVLEGGEQKALKLIHKNMFGKTQSGFDIKKRSYGGEEVISIKDFRVCAREIHGDFETLPKIYHVDGAFRNKRALYKKGLGLNARMLVFEKT